MKIADINQTRNPDILIHVPLMDHSSCKWFWNWPPIFSNDGQALLEASNCGETHGEAMVALQKPNFWSRCRENVSEILGHVGYLRIRWIEAGWTAAANWLKASHFLHQLEDLFSSWLSVNLSSCWLCWPLCQLSYRHRKYQLTSRRPAISIHRTSIFDAWHREGHFSYSNPSRTIETLYFQWLTTVTVYIYGL